MMDRRAAVSGLAVSALHSAGFGSPVHAAPGRFDSANPRDVLSAVRKLAFSGDSSLTFFWLRATRMGLVDTAFTPLWEMHVGQFFTVSDWGDGGFEVSSMALMFYTDVATGAFLETFKNPYTGRSNAIRYAAPRVNKRHYNADGEQRAPLTREGLNIVMNLKIGPAWTEGDQVWVRADTSLRGTPIDPSKTHPWHVNDWSTYTGQLKHVADSDVKNPPSQWIFNDINTWPDWLEMGDHPGNSVARGIGYKAYSFDAMPEVWKALVKQKFPQIASDPAGALKA